MALYSVLYTVSSVHHAFVSLGIDTRRDDQARGAKPQGGYLMEYYSDTMDKICDVENILTAYEKTLKRNSGAGVDGMTVQEFADNAQNYLRRLQEDMATGAYKPSPLLRFYVDKGDGEQRALNIPTVYDRVAQQAVCAVITPMLDGTFEPCSYGYRKGKGRSQAIDEIIRLRDAEHWYVVNADIDNCFDSIDHDILLQRFSELIPDETVIELVANWVKAEILNGNMCEKMTSGLPQGMVLSPLLSNLYLDLFDKVMLERGYSLIRYADDFVIIEKQYSTAQQAIQLAQHLLAQLKLRLNPDKTEIITFKQGFRYLGATFTEDEVLVSEQDTLKLNQNSKTNSNSGHYYSSSNCIDSVDDRNDSEISYKNNLDIEDQQYLLNRNVTINKKSNDGEHIEDSADVHFSGSNTAVMDDIYEPDDVVTPKADSSLDTWIAKQFQAMQETIQQLRIDMFRQQTEVQSEEDNEQSIVREKLNQTLSTSQLLSTIYIQDQGTTLSYSQKRFIVSKKDDVLLDVPAIKIKQILILGQCSPTTPVIDYCLKTGIPISFASSRGSYYGRLVAPVANQVTLHQQQFVQCANKEFALKMAKAFVEGKIHNQRSILQRRQRKLSTPKLESAIKFLSEMTKRSQKAITMDELRGYEGTCSATYFGVFGDVLDSGFSFSKREKFPATDPVNAMLSFGYTLLFQNIYSLVEMHNLHPYCGHLHAIRDGHPALVSDLMEEFRAPIVDSLVIYLINSHIIKPSDFEQIDGKNTKCLLKSEARKTFIDHFEKKLQAHITHPHTGYNIDYRRCIDLQIRELV